MECCLEVQHLGALLEKARSSLLSQELELERLRPCEALLGASQPQQVSMAGGGHIQPLVHRGGQRAKDYTDVRVALLSNIFTHVKVKRNYSSNW